MQILPLPQMLLRIIDSPTRSGNGYPWKRPPRTPELQLGPTLFPLSKQNQFWDTDMTIPLLLLTNFMTRRIVASSESGNGGIRSTMYFLIRQYLRVFSGLE